jgi:flagellar hook-associated protein 2
MSSSSILGSLLSSSNSSTGIDISSLLEAATGASTPGIDVTSAVDAAVSAAETPESLWESEESTVQSQATALTQLQTDASNLDSDMQSLNSITGPLSATTTSSSNSSVVTASSVSGSALGNYVVTVNSLATNDSWSSTALPSESSTVPAGRLTITTADGTATTITTDGTQSLSDLASQINGDNLGLTANVITDATGSRLSVVSDTTGSASNFTISTSGESGFGFGEVQPGTNASLTVNGNQISSASNTITGAISGLTLNLLGTSSSPVTLTVSPDTSQVSSAISQFVSDYNTLMSAINSQYADTNGSGQGVLATDPTLRTLQTSLLQAVDYTYTASSGSVSVPNLTSLGISMNKDGTLTLDTETLDSALQTNFSGVQQFFQGSALNGFANSLDQQLTNFTSPADGAFTVDLQSMNTQYSDLETDVTNFQNNVITPLKSQLQSEYSTAEIALQQLPGEIKDVDAELGMNNSNSNS